MPQPVGRDRPVLCRRAGRSPKTVMALEKIVPPLRQQPSISSRDEGRSRSPPVSSHSAVWMSSRRASVTGRSLALSRHRARHREPARSGPRLHVPAPIRDAPRRASLCVRSLPASGARPRRPPRSCCHGSAFGCLLDQGDDLRGVDRDHVRHWATFRSPVNERAVVEVDGRKLVLLGPIVLGMLPFRLVAAFGSRCMPRIT